MSFDGQDIANINDAQKFSFDSEQLKNGFLESHGMNDRARRNKNQWSNQSSQGSSPVLRNEDPSQINLSKIPLQKSVYEIP